MILITGSNGFLGQYLSNFLVEKSYSVLAHTRKAQTFDHPNIRNINFDLNDNLDNIDLSKVEVIIHCAGRAHVMHETSTSPLEAASLNTVSIVSDIPIMREVLDNHAIYVNPTSVEAITTKISEVYENKINVGDLTKNFPILLDKYSWDKTGEQIKKLILESI